VLGGAGASGRGGTSDATAAVAVGFPELSCIKIVDCKRLCGAPGAVPTLLNLVRLCGGGSHAGEKKRKLRVSFCGEGTGSEVTAFVGKNKCEQFWMKTEKHRSGANRHVVHVEVLPREYVSCAQMQELLKKPSSRTSSSTTGSGNGGAAITTTSSCCS
jgi:hypothetical protein